MLLQKMASVLAVGVALVVSVWAAVVLKLLGVAGAPFFGIGIFLFLVGAFVLQGLEKVPTVHKAIVTYLGKRLVDGNGRAVTKDEGWRFFPLKSFLFGAEIVSVERIHFSVDVEVMTPDQAKSRVPIPLTIRPLADHLIEYQNSGGGEGVKTALVGKAQERVREWAMGAEEGPATWQELKRAQLEAASVLVRAVVGGAVNDDFGKIPFYAQAIPTFVWLRFFMEPKPRKFSKNEMYWVRNDWAKVRGVYDSLSQAQKNELKAAVEKRRAAVQSLRSGTGNVEIENLGVTLERLNLADVELTGEVAKLADLEARAREERKAEDMKIKHITRQIKNLMKDSDLQFTKEEAKETVQVERGKTTKTIDEKKFNVSPETRGLLVKIVERIFGRQERS